jgi:HAE1 family hydrophobic/amphiphilic exporter-1/multidrug efflux pump
MNSGKSGGGDGDGGNASGHTQSGDYFFIRRPILAAVISIVICLAGILGGRALPISQYPEIAPPTINITANYPGASAETLAKTVAPPIEEQLNGVDGLIYYTSTAGATGTLTVTATFEVGTNADIATVLVSNRLRSAEPRLPEEVRRNGVTVQKRSNDLLLAVAIQSPDKTRDTLFLSNFAALNVVEDLKRLPGVGDITIFGAQDYSMRIWLQPDRMAERGLTTSDIADAIRAQNTQVAYGKIGQAPAPGQSLIYTVTARGRLLAPEEFGEIVLRAGGPDGTLRLKDVARIELGAQSYDAVAALNGSPTIGLGVFLAAGANALAVADAVRAKMESLQGRFPSGVAHLIPFDTTRFVDASIREVTHTLLEATALVVLVVFVFLQNWRATLIPLIAVPVSLLGTLGGIWALGFTLNTLSLFAMVLAIGIVVDDAIVILENVERHMREDGVSAREATVRSMREVTSAVVAIVLVLSFVFLPVAFLGGVAGRLYQQFAVTVTLAVVISGLVALTLTPALCPLLLAKHQGESPLFRPFNRAFAALTAAYTRAVGFLLAHSRSAGWVFLALCLTAGVVLQRTPRGFVPPEDLGYLIASIALPDGATLARTLAFGEQVRARFAQDPAVEHIMFLGGFDFLAGGNRNNAGTMFLPLHHWDKRDVVAADLAKKLFGQGMALRDGMALVFNPPPIRGLGSAGGFEFYLQSRQDPDPKHLAAVLGQLLDTLRARPELTAINAFFRATAPQLRVEVDEARAMSLGVPIQAVHDTLQASIGALYVNDFNKGGRTYRVQMQAEPAQRNQPEDIGRIHVRTGAGAMVPLSVLLTVQPMVGPEQVDRYNGFLAAKVMGNGAAGVSSGQAIALVEQVAASSLPEGYSLDWTGQAFQEKRAGTSSVQAFVFALLMVFLILAAQYERWSLPLAVVLSVPFALFGALVAVWVRGLPNDIYFQIGLVTLIGLAAKNAILIIEFAHQRRLQGMTAAAAALEAARIRFRPIVMTSLAFVFGVLPLVFAEGAGAAARRSMGTGVFGGMLAATFIATLFIPLFFRWLSRERDVAAPAVAAPAAGEKDADPR